MCQAIICSNPEVNNVSDSTTICSNCTSEQVHPTCVVRGESMVGDDIKALYICQPVIDIERAKDDLKLDNRVI